MTLTKQWTDTIDRAVKDAAWDDYDKVIQAEVDDYRTRLGLVVSDWKIFKAQIWTETGAANPAWKTRPMQIGKKEDKAITTLRQHKEFSWVIMSDQVMADLKKGRSVDDPNFNIQLGLAYAYTQLSTFGSVADDKTILTYEVKSGDSVISIAAKVGTTKENIWELNPTSKKTIFPKQVIKYQKAKYKPTMFAVTAQRLQQFYNRGGDPDYADKITYCYNIILNLKR